MVRTRLALLALPLALTAACGNSTAGTPVPHKETPIQTAERIHDECHSLANQQYPDDQKKQEIAVKFCVLSAPDLTPAAKAVVLGWHPEWGKGS